MDTATIQLDITQPIKSISNAYEGDIAIKIKGKTTINGLGTLGNFGKDTNADGLADGWTGFSAGTFSLVNGEQTFTPTAQGGQIYASTSCSLLSGRIIVYISNAKTTDNTVTPDGIGILLVQKTHTGSGNYEKIGRLAQLNANLTSITTIPSKTNKTSAFVLITVKQAFYVDVTDYPELVGLTNQQKLDWCLANLEYCDGMDNVRTIEVESVGKNLFDGIWYKSYSDYGGGGVPALGWTFTADAIRTDYIKVKPSTNYFLKNSRTIQTYYTFFDKDKVKISITPSTLGTLITPSNAVYIVFHIFTSGTVTPDWTAQLEEGTTATAYEPYKERKTTINHTLRSKGATKDELEYRNGSITKIQRISDDGLTILQTPIETKWFNPTRIKAFNGYNQFTVGSAGLTPQVEVEYPLNFEGAQYLSYFPRRPR